MASLKGVVKCFKDVIFQSFLTALVQKPENKPVEKYEDIEKIRIKVG